jgi:hypothetical protein
VNFPYSFTPEQLIGLRFALEGPAISSAIATLPLIPTEEQKLNVFRALGNAITEAHDVCTHCKMPRHQHVRGKCIFMETRFEKVTADLQGLQKYLSGVDDIFKQKPQQKPITVWKRHSSTPEWMVQQQQALAAPVKSTHIHSKIDILGVNI